MPKIIIVFLLISIISCDSGNREYSLEQLALKSATQLEGIKGKLNTVEMQAPFGPIFIEGDFNQLTIKKVIERNSFYLTDKNNPELSRISGVLKNHQIAKLEDFVLGESSKIYVVTWTSTWECRMKIFIVTENRMLLISTGNPTQDFFGPSAQCFDQPASASK